MVDSIDDRKFQRKSKKKLKGEDAKALKRLSMDEVSFFSFSIFFLSFDSNSLSFSLSLFQSVPIYVNISEIEVKKVIKVSRWVENKLWIRANCGKDQWSKFITKTISLSLSPSLFVFVFVLIFSFSFFL